MRNLLLLVFLFPTLLSTAGKYFEVAYPPSEKPHQYIVQPIHPGTFT